jgi:hypothetical protein
MEKSRNEMLRSLSRIEGTHLHKENKRMDGNETINFYKYGSDRIIGPLSCTNYSIIGEEQYDKIINLINHGTEAEIKKYDEELVQLVKGGCKPGMPYIVLDGEGYIMVEKVFNKPESGVKVKGWTELKDEELSHWCDVVDNLN